MILTNIETAPGKSIVAHYGLVAGSTIRAKHIGRDLMASLKNLVGGELKGYTQLMQESRQQAVDRMIEQAKQLGANAIVNVRFSTSSVAQGAAELYAYGTAVKVESDLS
jgi:uncharacterized protein YbjQ (UPF0145 family)